MQKKIIRIAVITAIILLIPFVATRVSEEVNWDVFDFVIMGAVIFGVGLAYELVAKKSKKSVYRLAFALGLAGAFLLFWVNGAVGIIGSENQPANLLYGLVFVVGFFGAVVSRFKPRGMALTLFGAAAVQMLVPVLALIIWPPPATSWAPSVFGVFVLSGFFALLFFVSALLFQRAGKTK